LTRGGGDSRHGQAANESSAENAVADAPAANRVAEHTASVSEFVPGQISGLPDKKLPVATYIEEINKHWEQAQVEDFQIADYCAHANRFLNPAEKAEVRKRLRFSPSIYSKYVKIGNEPRFRSPDVQPKLPRGYTILYLLALFKDDEFQAALADNVISSERTREELLQWRSTYRERRNSGSQQGGPEESASERGRSPDETKPPALTENVPADNNRGDTQPVTTESPSLVPQGDENAPSAVDDGPLSDDEQRAYEKLIAAWNSFVDAWSTTLKRAQDRFKSKVGPDLSSTFGATPAGGES
jgi:hypothetical protein